MPILFTEKQRVKRLVHAVPQWLGDRPSSPSKSNVSAILRVLVERGTGVCSRDRLRLEQDICKGLGWGAALCMTTVP